MNTEGFSFDSYTVEYYDRRGRWARANFTNFGRANNFFATVRSGDLLGFTKYKGYTFIDSK